MGWQLPMVLRGFPKTSGWSNLWLHQQGRRAEMKLVFKRNKLTLEKPLEKKYLELFYSEQE